MPTPPRHRWRTAFARVRAIERDSSVLVPTWRPGRWLVHGSTAVRANTRIEELPRYLRPRGPVTDRRRARVGADLIRIGKFDVDAEVRLRAFYLDSRRTVRFQAGGQRNGVERSLFAHQYLVQYAPDLGPPVLDHGTIGQAPYLVEEVVEGRHPSGGRELERTLAPVTERLSALHTGFGITHEPLADILGQGFPARWQEAVATGLVDAATERAVGSLLARRGTVPVSLGHGDLVGTNILIRPGGLTLIDWEYAGRLPVLFDVAKLHLHSPDSNRALAALERGLRTSLRHGTADYSVREQLALAHVRYLAWEARRRQRAQAANRLDQLRQITDLRLRAVRHLLGLG